jgi:hypothetical protein
VPGVAQVGTIRWGVAKLGEGDGRDWIAAVQPSTLERLMTVDMVDGDAGALAKDALLVSKAVADREGWTVGQELRAEFAATGAGSIVLGGVYEVNPLAGDYLISTALHDRSFTDKVDSAVMLSIADGADRAAVVAGVERALEPYPNVRMLDQAQFSADQQGFVDTILGLVNALLALAILIAMFGIVNTLALSVFERTREIGLLRAVGMSRRQLRRMIRLESVLISTFGRCSGSASASPSAGRSSARCATSASRSSRSRSARSRCTSRWRPSSGCSPPCGRRGAPRRWTCSARSRRRRGALAGQQALHEVLELDGVAHLDHLDDVGVRRGALSPDPQ